MQGPPDPAHLQLTLIMEAKAEAREARTDLRALEQLTGQVLEPGSGTYWLQRITCLEYIASAVARGDHVAARRALHELDAIPFPACHPNDHQAKTARG